MDGQISLFDYLSERKSLSVKSLFSGAGGMEYGLSQAGLKIEESYEFWDKACDTLTANMPHDIYKCDITRLMLGGQKKTFCISATFPCTHFSSAGLRDGDELYLEAHRIIRCLEPEVFVIENVVGMKNFPVVMEAFMEMPHYHVKQFILNASDFGAPQNRKRLIILGSKQSFDWTFEPFPMEKRTFLRDIIEPNVDLPLCKGAVNRLAGVNKGQWPAHIYDPAVRDYGPTCVAHYGKDQTDQLTVDPGTGQVRSFTLGEYAAMQGFPPSYEFKGGKAASFKQVGNAVSPYMACAIGREIMRYASEKK